MDNIVLIKPAADAHHAAANVTDKKEGRMDLNRNEGKLILEMLRI